MKNGKKRKNEDRLRISVLITLVRPEPFAGNLLPVPFFPVRNSVEHCGLVSQPYPIDFPHISLVFGANSSVRHSQRESL